MRPLSVLSTAGLLLFLAGCTPGSDGGTASTTTSTSPPAGSNSTAGSGGGSGGGGGTLRIGVMPKVKSVDYFNAVKQGAEQAAKELGDVEVIYEGPLQDKSEEQSAIVDTWTTQKFDAITVACNDPDQIAPSLARARDAGITVTTYDADTNPESSKRQFFVNQVATHDLCVALVDEMAEQAGADAKVAVVSSSPTAPNQSTWLKEMETYRKQKYPKMAIAVTEYAGENQQESFSKAQGILKAYPDVKGIWGMTSVAFPGAADAVEKAGKAGKVAVVGLGTPKAMKPFVDKGVVKTVILWNPVDLGNLAVQVARAVAKGELKEGATSFKAGSLGEKKVDGQVVLLGPPMKFTRETIGNFDF